MAASRRKPWFHKSRNTWYVTIDGKQVNLRTSDKDAAWTAWHKLLSEERASGSVTNGDGLRADELFSLFLVDVKATAAPATFAWYQRYLASLASHLPSDLLADQLRRKHVLDWIRAAGYESPSQRAAIAAVKRSYHWGVEHEHILVSPITGLKKPPVRRRDTILSAEQVRTILENSSAEFADLLVVSLETGCRPQEIRAIEARHVNADASAVELSRDEHKTGKATGEGRTIYLTEAAAEIIRRQADLWPQGVLFRNRRGDPWTSNAIRCRLRRLRKKVSSLPDRLCHYNLRHTFATEALVAGVHPEELRVLMGHKDMDMIVKHYSHLAKKTEHMKDVARRARSGGQASPPPAAEAPEASDPDPRPW